MNRFSISTLILCFQYLLATEVAADGLVAETTRVRSVVVLNDSAAMLFEEYGWLSTTTGTVARGGFPTTISVGDELRAGGRTLTVGIIQSTIILEDYSGWGMEFSAGDTTCVAVEDERNLPSDESRDRLWVYVESCRVLR